MGPDAAPDVRGSKYTSEQLSALHLVSGDSLDWCYGRTAVGAKDPNALGLVLPPGPYSVGNTYTLPTSEILPAGKRRFWGFATLTG
jgi:hypothetical protein